MNEETADAVRQWLAKAESDIRTVEILLPDAACPRDVVCFHCQQYVEKLLKALLTLHGIEAPKTHNLRRLIQLAVSNVPELNDLIDDSDRLTEHGVTCRYPDDWREIGTEEMEQMIRLARKFGAILVPKLNA
ncbi:MAG: HEPN domain-containing protein [Nitrospinae bacterium]|nr:HEPN domain-containing protein [Nitrospinota bacterium]